MCLPVVIGKGKPLVFRRWRLGDTLVDAQFKTQIPAEDQDVLEPDCLLVPLLGFTADGYRLGYGGGFYDRTIRKLNENRGECEILYV